MPRRDYIPRPEVAKLTDQVICADAKGMSITVGQQRSQKPLYVAGVYTDTGAPVYYAGHRWSVVKTTCSLQAGLCASADSFGEIHIWRSKTGKRVKVLQPVGHTLHHIQWEPDESGIQIGTRHLSPDKNDKAQYSFNCYGPVTNSFSFKDWQMVTDDRPAVYPKSLPVPDRSTGRLDNILYDSNAKEILLQSAGGRREGLLARERQANEKRRLVAKKWGEPTYIAVLPESGRSRPHIAVGTDNGSLLEFAIESSNGRNELKLIRQFLGHDARVTALSVSPTGNLLASASIDGSARIWRLDAPRELVDTDFFTDGTRVIYLAPGGSAESAGIQIGDSIRQFEGAPYYERIQKIQAGNYKVGQQIAIGFVRNDGRKNAHFLETEVRLIAGPDIQEPVLNLFFTKEDQWIAWNQNGFYNASPQGSEHVGWHVNRGRDEAADFSLVSQFRKQLYSPSIVQATADRWETVSQEPLKEQTYSVLLPNTSENYRKMRPPKITITSHQSSISIPGDEIDVDLAIETPSRLKIKDFSVFNNQNEVRTRFVPSTDPPDISDGLTTTKYRVSIPVQPGENNLVFEVKHKEASSNRAVLKVVSQKVDPASKLPKLYILAVGISEYEDERLNLKYAAKDARDFVKAWEAQEGEIYSKVESKILVNDGASTENIEDGFEWLADQKPGAKDVVFVFFSGHAFYSDTDFWYFGGNDLDVKKLKRTGVSKSDVVDLLEGELRDAGMVVAFMDTCRPSKLGPVHHSEPKDVWNQLEKPIILSCYQKQTSQELESLGNGAFTHGLIQSLGNKRIDRNGDQHLDLSELLNGVRKFVHKQTKQAQTPELSGTNRKTKKVNLARIRNAK